MSPTGPTGEDDREQSVQRVPRVRLQGMSDDYDVSIC